MLRSSISLGATSTPGGRKWLAPVAMNLIGPQWVEIEERVPGLIPLAHGLHLVAGGRGNDALLLRASRPAASASSRRMGAPRLHEWIDIDDPTFRATKRISSRG